jgi:hypothetical protein
MVACVFSFPACDGGCLRCLAFKCGTSAFVSNSQPSRFKSISWHSQCSQRSGFCSHRYRKPVHPSARSLGSQFGGLRTPVRQAGESSDPRPFVEAWGLVYCSSWRRGGSTRVTSKPSTQVTSMCGRFRRDPCGDPPSPSRRPRGGPCHLNPLPVSPARGSCTLRPSSAGRYASLRFEKYVLAYFFERKANFRKSFRSSQSLAGVAGLLTLPN